MPSATYGLVLRAMREKQQVVCIYQGYRREFCPILLGRTGLEEFSLIFQFGGETSKGRIPASGEWKCFRLAEIREIVLRDGPWRSGDSHSSAQTCMKMVEYDVNPESPYDPRVPAVATRIFAYRQVSSPAKAGTQMALCASGGMGPGSSPG